MIGRLVKDAVTRPLGTRVAGALLPPTVAVLMLHRFTDRPGEPGKHPAAVLRHQLDRLRRDRFDLVSLADCMAMLREGRTPSRPTVAFTVDDGYRDFAEVAAPVFEDFGCPVTVFLTTGFLDRSCWLWWDRLEDAAVRSDRRSLDVRLGDERIRLAWSDRGGAAAEASRLAHRVQWLLEADRLRLVDRVVEALGVAQPPAPPDAYGPMDWSQARALESRGVSFGPHTVTHPILSRVSSDRADAEMGASWTRLQDELGDPLPVFCYPHGGAHAFSGRECERARDLGMEGGVTTRPAYVPVGEEDSGPDALYRVPRFGCPEDEASLVAICSGLTRLGGVLRGWAGRVPSPPPEPPASPGEGDFEVTAGAPGS